MADAKKAQVVAMKDYIGGCQAFFEKVLTDILLRQPPDPHAFLLETLTTMSSEEKSQWQQKVKAASSGDALVGGLGDENAFATSSAPRTKDNVVVMLRLNLTEEGGKPKVLGVLKDLRDQARQLQGCMSYEISDRIGEPELLVTQVWANQSALDNFYAQSFFQEAAPKFAGLLADHPDYCTYTPVT